MAERIVVVGLPATAPLPSVALLVGGRRQLDEVAAGAGAAAAPGRTVTIGGDLQPVLDAIAAEPGPVAVVASGDPGFFGIVRALAERFGPDALEVRPAPSSVSLAFARLGLPWDDAVVVSAHGRPLAAAAAEVAGAAKAAVLVSPENPPEALGKELLAAGADVAQVVVCTRLGLAGEVVTRTDLAGLAAGCWDPLSVVVVLSRSTVAPRPQLAWGRHEATFAHRGGMVTKAEVRAVALGKLDLPAHGVLWDVGAGSGSVAVECALLCPALRVYAVEDSPEDRVRIDENATRLGAAVTLVGGRAPGVLDRLPDPDRAFVGGGGLDVLDAVMARLRPGGVVVATYAALDRAAAAAGRLGQLVQIAASRGQQLPDGGWRLDAANPVFVAWGPRP